eukprot:gene2617-3577_t
MKLAVILFCAVFVSSAYWVPPVATPWQWQLQNTIKEVGGVQIYDIDVFDNSAAVFTKIKSFQGGKGKIICYINVGAWENWRSDKNDFPSSILGKDYDGWAGEKWLDIRNITALGPILKKRFQMCKDKGGDAIEPDNLDSYQNGLKKTGFNITENDQINFDKWLVKEAHALDLSIALKNDPDHISQLIDLFDFTITEDCFGQNPKWCDQLKPWIQKGKAVLPCEYTDKNVNLTSFCEYCQKNSFSGILKKRNLKEYLDVCYNGTKSSMSSGNTIQTSFSLVFFLFIFVIIQ